MQMAWLGAGAMVLIVIALMVLRIKERSESKAAEQKSGAKAERLRRELAMLDERYAFAHHAVCPEGRGAVGYAERDRVLVFLSADWKTDAPTDAAGDVRSLTVHASDVLDVEVVEHGYGATASAGTTTPMSRAIDLKVAISHPTFPVQVVGFLAGAVEMGSTTHRKTQMRAYRWEGLIRGLMAERNRVPSVNDQLQALDRALESGQMSAAEAKKAKAQIMSQRILSRARANLPASSPVNRETTV